MSAVSNPEFKNVVFIALLFALIIWNFVVMLMYAADKYRAKNSEWRIKESTLLGAAFLFGGVGALFGMIIFRHKTKHIAFKLAIPLSIIVNAALCYGIYSLLERLY